MPKSPLPLRLLHAGLLLLSLLLSHPLVGAAQGEWRYGVKPGDTLLSIASDYLQRPDHWRRLQSLNQVADPLRLMPGTQLRLPVALLKREAAAAVVLDVQGQVNRTSPGQRPQTLAVGQPLLAGDTVETGADATVSLRFVDGSRLLLTPQSSLTLTHMVLLGKSGIAQTLLELHRGSLDTRVSQQQKPAGHYEIKTRALNLAVRGTDFRAHVNAADQVSRGEVLEGAVLAGAGRGKRVALNAGFGTQAAPGTPPEAPRALARAPDLSRTPALLQRVPLRLDWAAAPQAAGYRAQVFADRSFDKLLLDGVFPTPGAKWADLPDGRYVLRVRAIDAQGFEGLNAEREFVLKARPEPPAIHAPQDGQKSYGPQTTLRWTSSTTARAYRVQLASTPDFAAPLVDASDLIRTEHTVALEPGPYYWRVASIAAAQDQGPFSDVQAFTQRRIPESPRTDAPQVDDRLLTFSWRAGEAGASYQLQLARDAAFTELLAERVLTTNQMQIERPEPGRYYLRIKTIDADGFAGPFGAAQQFEVPAPAPWWLLLLLPLAL